MNAFLAFVISSGAGEGGESHVLLLYEILDERFPYFCISKFPFFSARFPQFNFRRRGDDFFMFYCFVDEFSRNSFRIFPSCAESFLHVISLRITIRIRFIRMYISKCFEVVTLSLLSLESSNHSILTRILYRQENSLFST